MGPMEGPLSAAKRPRSRAREAAGEGASSSRGRLSFWSRGKPSLGANDALLVVGLEISTPQDRTPVTRLGWDSCIAYPVIPS
jgi:hypothetical protein